MTIMINAMGSRKKLSFMITGKYFNVFYMAPFQKESFDKSLPYIL